MRFKTLVMLALIFSGLAAASVDSQSEQIQDPYGRSADRVMQTEQLSRVDDELKREMALIDDLAFEQKEKKALAAVVFEPGATAGEMHVELKVRQGGAASLAMKGTEFRLGDAQDVEEWTVRSGSFDSPKKWKPLTVVVSPPGHKDLKAVCPATKEVAAGKHMVFA